MLLTRHVVLARLATNSNASECNPLYIIFNYSLAIVERRAPDSQSNTIDFRLVSRLTSSNSTIASKPAASKPVAPAAPKPAAPKPAMPKPAAPKPAAPKPASKLVAPKSTVSEPARKQVAPKSASEPARKQAAPVAKESPTQITRVMHDEDQASDMDPAVGGLLDEDDSLEREVAMSSPLKGAELRAAKQVRYIFIIVAELKFSQSIIKVRANQDSKLRKRATIQDLPDGANHESAWTRLVIPNFIRLVMAGEQPWLIGDDIIISDLQDVWDHVYGMRVPFQIKKGTVPFDLVSFFLSIYSFSCFSRLYRNFMTIEARLCIGQSV